VSDWRAEIREQLERANPSTLGENASVRAGIRAANAKALTRHVARRQQGAADSRNSSFAGLPAGYGGYGDAVSRQTIIEIEDLAKSGDCNEAVRRLYKAQALVTDVDPRTATLFRRAANVIAGRCTRELSDEAAERRSIRSAGPSLHSQWPSLVYGTARRRGVSQGQNEEERESLRAQNDRLLMSRLAQRRARALQPLVRYTRRHGGDRPEQVYYQRDGQTWYMRRGVRAAPQNVRSPWEPPRRRRR
jgi:hypothetical protein